MLMMENEPQRFTKTVGITAHRVIGTLLAEGRDPSFHDILAAIDTVTPLDSAGRGRAARVNVCTAVTGYFDDLLPPPAFLFFAAEMSIGSGRVDLCWRHHSTGEHLLDEVKTGSQPLGAAAIKQALRYADGARELYGKRLLGVRLLSTLRPQSSLLIGNDGTPTPLYQAGLTTRRLR